MQASISTHSKELIHLSEYSFYTVAALSVRNIVQLDTTSQQHVHEACLHAYTHLMTVLDDGVWRIKVNLEYDMHQETYTAFHAMFIYWIYSGYASFIEADRLQLYMSAETGQKILDATGESAKWLEAADIFIEYVSKYGFTPQYRVE